jgi:type IV secretory pathway protease TraF
MSKIPAVLLSLILVLLAVIALLPTLRLQGNLSASEPRGIYRLTHEPLNRGTYVVLKMPLKRIAAMPGDAVRVTPEGSYINGKLWPASGLPVEIMKDHRLEHYPFGIYILKPGQLWVLSNNPLGWDSRYFGPIDQHLVNATAEPVLTEDPR